MQNHNFEKIGNEVISFLDNMWALEFSYRMYLRIGTTLFEAIIDDMNSKFLQNHQKKFAIGKSNKGKA